MFGHILFFITGVVFTGTVMSLLLYSCKKKIKRLEITTADSAVNVLNFSNKTKKLAAAVRESAGSLSGNGNAVYGGDQTGSIEKVEGIIKENSTVAAEIVEKTNSVAAVASKMEGDVLKGFEILEKNVKKMEDTKEKNSGVINGIIALNNKVNKIQDIVRIINTITDQTKVIAFNAALEASSAGETGKRFAVVAGEVNRLADDIAGLTRQIREQIEEILSSSSFLIVHSEEGSDKISEGYKLIKDLENVFMEIRSGAEITSNQAQTITVSTKQQLKSSEYIYEGITEISQGVKRLIGASESAALTAGILTEQTGELERFLGLPIGQGEHGD